MSKVICNECNQATGTLDSGGSIVFDCGCNQVVTTANCHQSGSTVTYCGCQKCNPNPCGCANGPVLTTYEQSHSQTCQTPPQAFAKIVGEFTMPACGEDAPATINNVQLSVGAAIKNDAYGVLYVVSRTGNSYRLENRCDSCNITQPGEMIPSCTEFSIGISQCSVNSQNGSSSDIFLCKDFFIPEVGQTSNAQVTRFGDIVTGGQILLRKGSLSYTYTVIAKVGTDTLTLRNDGDGGTPGDWICADEDNDGIKDVVIDSLGTGNVCEDGSIESVADGLVVCKDGTQALLQGNQTGDIPSWNETTQQYEHVQVEQTKRCFVLDTCFQIAPPANPCDEISAFITTQDFTNFVSAAMEALISDVSGTIIEICDTQFVIDWSQSTATEVKILPVETPTAVVKFDTSCLVCIPADCCVQCDPEGRYPLSNPVEPNAPEQIDAISAAIPYTALQTPGHYNLCAIRDAAGTSNIMLVLDDMGNATSAYNESGTSISVPANPDELFYRSFTVCNESPCSAIANYEEDMNLDFIGLLDGMEISVQYSTLLEVYPCSDTSTGLIRQIPLVLAKSFRGPGNVYFLPTDIDTWEVPIVPGGGLISYITESASGRRKQLVSREQCVRVKTRIKMFLNVITPPPNTSDTLRLRLNSTHTIEMITQ